MTVTDSLKMRETALIELKQDALFPYLIPERHGRI